MDCSNCVCLLCCRYAQDKEHREKIHAGEISCCDYYPQPDHALEKAIKAVSEYVKAQILYKCNRALERYRKTGEV